MYPQKALLTLIFTTATFLHGKWGYSQAVERSYYYYSSTYNEICHDYCEKRGHNYFWCHTDKGWDYCSPSPKVDYTEKQCNSDFPCGTDCADTYRCKLENGEWSPCGLVKPELVLHWSSQYGTLCTDECTYDKKGGYFWCHTAKDWSNGQIKGWDYCSPLPDVTYRNQPCRAGYSCGKYSYSYYWCWTESSWDYCGMIQESECKYKMADKEDTSASSEQLECSEYGSSTIVTLLFEEDINVTSGMSYLDELQELVHLWESDYLRSHNTLGIVVTKHFRIDSQDLITTPGQVYYDLHIHRNMPSPTSQCSSFARVCIPSSAQIPSRYFRHAFLESIWRQARVVVNITIVGDDQQLLQIHEEFISTGPPA